MTAEVRALIVDLVEWVAARPRTYDDVMDAWRTSCPRLTIWEDTIDQGLVARVPGTVTHGMVEVTDKGFAMLVAEGRSPGVSDSRVAAAAE